MDLKGFGSRLRFKVLFPIGLWIFSLICDLIHLTGASGDA